MSEQKPHVYIGRIGKVVVALGVATLRDPLWGFTTKQGADLINLCSVLIVESYGMRSVELCIGPFMLSVGVPKQPKQSTFKPSELSVGVPKQPKQSTFKPSEWVIDIVPNTKYVPWHEVSGYPTEPARQFPSVADIYGIDTDFTNGMSSDEYIRSLRSAPSQILSPKGDSLRLTR